jgi:hypothetical protein
LVGGAAISGATVRVNDGTLQSPTSATDGNGYYSIPGVRGSVSLIATKTGYDTAQRTVTVSSDTRFDFTMGRTVAAPAPRTRIGATCNDNTSSDATGSGACSSHGGVRCWRYSDGSCTNP